MVGKSVWIVKFFNKELLDVYASKERALAAIDKKFLHNEGHWVNRTLISDGELCRVEFFYCEGIKVEFYVYEACIQ